MWKFNIKTYCILLFTSLTYFVHAQLIITSPTFPQENQLITITFNAELGSAGLANYSGDIYAHTGVITNLSTSQSDWKYVKTNWGQNTPETKLTKIGINLYTITISPNPRAYYGVPTGEQILRLAFVFRSAVAVGGSYLEGKSSDGSDIFVDIYSGSGININLQKPASGYVFLNIGDSLPISAASINADSIFIYKNKQLISSDSGNIINDTVIASNFGKYWIKAEARNSNTFAADSFYYYVRDSVNIAPLPTEIIEGINYIDSTKVILCLFAPFKDYAFVIGDFNNWMPDTSYYMNKTPDGKYFWLEIENLIPNKEYIFQYFVDGDIKIGDPYAEKVSDPWNDSYITSATYPNMLTYPNNKTKGIATVLQTNQKEYQWKNQNFVAPKKEDLVIYELLIRDFTAKHTFDALVDSLHYLKTLGVNAIELMPVNEFEGNNSWGYNTNYYFAVDKYYGTKDRLKHLIDTCHSQGIAVILDVVYNHSFGTSPYVMLWWDAQNNRPAANNPFFNQVAKHDFNVGFDMNHESADTRKYISRSLVFWTNKYHVDGFRFDLSKGFTQTNTLGNSGAMANYDASRIYTLNRYADSVWAHNSNAYVILEHFADNSEEKELSSRGLMLWGNLNNNYSEAAMGYNNSGKSDFGWISYQKRAWTKPYLVGYMESHDEERLMYKCSQWGNILGNYNITEKSTYMERASLDAMLFLTIPGPKMIWQFGELGYDISIDENGRTGSKPIKWEYIYDDDRYNNYLVYKALINLRKEESSCFQTSDYDINVSGSLKYVKLRDTSMNAIAFGNFDVDIDTLTLAFPHDGIWYDYLSQQEIEVKNNNFFFKLLPGEYHLLIDKKKVKPELAIEPKRIITDTLNFTGSLEIFPNPTDGDFYLYINSSEDITINIFDINGKLISKKSLSGKEKQVIKINTTDLGLRAGVYFCSIQNSEGIITKKFIVL